MPITSMNASRHSGEDVEVTVTGTVTSHEVIRHVIFDPKDHSDASVDCVTARVMDVFRAIQSGTLCLLCWDDQTNPILPLEGYGVTDLHKFNGLLNPRLDGWKGEIVLYVFGPDDGEGRFTISVDLTKQRK